MTLYLALRTTALSQGVGGGKSLHRQDERPPDSIWFQAVPAMCSLLTMPLICQSLDFCSWSSSLLKLLHHPRWLQCFMQTTLPTHSLNSSSPATLNNLIPWPNPRPDHHLSHPAWIRHSDAYSLPSNTAVAIQLSHSATPNKPALCPCWVCYSLTPRFSPTCYILPPPPSVSSFHSLVQHVNHSFPKIQHSFASVFSLCVSLVKLQPWKIIWLPALCSPLDSWPPLERNQVISHNSTNT